MNKTIARAFFIFVAVAISAAAVKLILPRLQEKQQKQTSDAAKIKSKINIAIDNWIGYFILDSPEFKSLMRKKGFLISCEDDHADYAGRMKRLNEGSIDFAVATVDSYILNAASVNYPGTMVMVIDESKGGDAILARKDKISSLDDLKTKQNIRVAFTPDSPSHHLAKAASEHFNVPQILPQGNLRILTEGSKKACDDLLANKADVAICWEPDVSRALSNPDIIKILGTEDTEKLIVDILIVNRSYAAKNPDIVKIMLNNYFRALKAYRDDQPLLLKDIESQTGISEKSVKSMLGGVEWINFNANCENWFGIAAPGVYADEGLIETIESTTRILISAKDFTENPIPEKDPYRLTNSKFLNELYQQGGAGFTTPKPSDGNAANPVSSISASFSALSSAQWDKLKEVGTLKVEPIIFQHGTTELDNMAKKVVDEAVERLKHYPNFRLVIKGHTGVRGDKNENLRLSQERAESVARYLEVAHRIDPHRIRAIGYGALKPLPKEPGESNRAWNYRLPRVELVLVREDF